jgi:glycosyltransferase involved in cell wall biosynthesis
MKILYLHQYFSEPHNSYGGRSYDFSVRLFKKGHNIDIVTSHNLLTKALGFKKKCRRMILEGINIHIIRSNYSGEMRFLKRIKAFLHFAIFSSLYILKLPRTDVVFATSTPLTIGIPGIIAAKLWSRPLVFEVRDLWPEVPIQLGWLKNPILKRFAWWLEQYIYSQSTRIIALSDVMADGVAAIGYPRDRIVTIPNSSNSKLFQCDPDVVKQLRLKYGIEDSFICLYAGSIGFVHGVPILVDVANILKDSNPEVKIVIIGEGSERYLIEEGVKRHALTNLLLLNPIPRGEVVKWVAAANLGFVLAQNTLLAVDSNNKYFDYCAGGLPVLVNALGLVADQIEANNAGFAVRDGSSEGMVEAILRAVKKPALISEMRVNAARLGREVFDIEIRFAQFEQVLSDAVVDWKKRPQRGYLHLKDESKL